MLISNNSDKNAKIREAEAMGVKNDITADKSITTKFNRRHKAALAEAKGFEPLRLLGKRFSRPPRYDHFDKLPFI